MQEIAAGFDVAVNLSHKVHVHACLQALYLSSGRLRLTKFDRCHVGNAVHMGEATSSIGLVCLSRSRALFLFDASEKS